MRRDPEPAAEPRHIDNGAHDPAYWRRFGCDRIDAFRRGDCDFEGMFLAFTIFAAMVEDGVARPSAPIRRALQALLEAAAPYADGRNHPPPGAIERELRSLADAIRRDGH